MQDTSLKQRAQAFLNQGKLEQARKIYQQLCEKNSIDAESHYMLGSIYGRLGKFQEAIPLFRKTIKLQPDAIIAHCGLGAALQGQGLLSEAEQAFQDALRLQPNSPDILLELGKTQIRLKKFSDAEQHLKRVLTLNPGSDSAHFSLGEIHRFRGEWQEAVDCYERALELNPKHPGIHFHLGHTLNVLARYEQAEPQFREALRIAPEFLPAYTGLGQALAGMGRAVEARSAYHNALRIDPDNMDVIILEAALSEQEGDFKAAYEQLTPLIKRGVIHPGLVVTYANLCHQTGRSEEAIDYLERWLRESGVPPAQSEGIHFALGKFYDATGNYDKAFEHYQQGNDLTADNGDDSEYALEFEKIIRTFDWNFMVAAPRASLHTERPVFVVGMPRSGTSLTEQILASHPDVFGAGELMDIHDYATSLSTRLGTELPYPDNMKKLTTKILDSVAQDYLDHLSQLDANAVRVIDKMPQNFIFLGFIALLFPNAKIIHCIRDPRDVCLSNYFQRSGTHQYANRLESLGAYYRQYAKLMQHWRSLLNTPILEVQYEDLVANQEDVSRRLIEFIGLKWDKRCLEFHETRRYVATPSYDQVRQPLYTKSAGRWRNYERHIGPLLRALDL